MATNKGSNSVVSSNSLPLSERTQCQYSMWAKFRRMLFRRRSLRAKLLIGLVFLLLVSILFLFPFFFAPAQRFSTSNNLNFGRSVSSSPLQNPPFAELLTAGIAPKRIHSHNDYLRATPLFEALSLGIPSVEADVWLVDGQLLIGHTDKGLSTDRTLESLYLQPILSLIDAYNVNNTELKRGIFDTVPHLPLTLYIDIKSDGASTFPIINQSLSTLRSRGYLSTYNASSPSTSPPTYSLLTIIGTGNTPLSSVQALNPRDIFFDAPLSDISSSVYQPSLSPIASGSFSKLIGASWLPGGKGKSKINSLIQTAHAKGIMTRFWSTPSIPTWARNQVWSILLDAGTDFLNADDIASAASF